MGTGRRKWNGIPDEYRLRTRQGAYRWFLARADVLRDPSGTVLHWIGTSTDIDDTKQAEQALRESEARLQAILDRSPAAIFIKAADGRHLFMNEECARALSVDRAQAAGKTEYELFPATLADQFRRNDLMIWSSGKGQVIEEKVEQPDGVHTYLSNKFLLRDAEGVPYALCGIATDVTERKQIEHVLRDRERLLSTVTGTAHVGLAIVEPGYVYRFANEAYAELLHLPSPVIVGRLVPDVLREGWHQIQPRLDRAFAGDRVAYELTFQSEHAAEGHRHYAVSYEPHIDPDGQRTVVVVVVDISERRRVEENLRESEERFRGTFDNAAVGIALLDLHGRWLRVNDKMCDITGYSRSELLTRTFQDITHPADLEDDLDSAGRLVAGDIATYSMEKRYIRKDGSVVWVNLTVSLVKDPAGVPLHYISVVKDISARRAAEEEIRVLLAHAEQREQELREKQSQLVQAAKLASLGEMAAGIAHEINNPLNNINLFIANALDHLESGQTEHAKPVQHLRSAAKQIERAATIVSHLRTFARASSAPYERVDVHAVLRSALLLMDLQLRFNNIDVAVQLAAHTAVVQGNAIQLEQVFVNLLSNARDAVESTPCKRIVVRSRVDEPHLTIAVEDNGAGISADLLARLFDPFFTTKEPGRGTGLGLSISYGILKEHGGTIAVESTPGQGSVFIVRLPVAP